MKFKFTILTIVAGLALLICAGDLIYEYKTLSEGEGWGVIFMLSLIGIAVSALVVDFIIKLIFRKKQWLRQLVAAIVLALYILYFTSNV